MINQQIIKKFDQLIELCYKADLTALAANLETMKSEVS